MTWLDGGVFQMGSDHHYPEEAPRHPVKVEGFSMTLGHSPIGNSPNSWKQRAM